jgi:hypothetical protein
MLRFQHVQNLAGGSQKDVFLFSGPGHLSGTVDGGTGNNWLDYAPYAKAVEVNLATGAATGVAGGVAKIRDVRGGDFGDTLVGNAQGNVLIGGPTAT